MKYLELKETQHRNHGLQQTSLSSLTQKDIWTTNHANTGGRILETTWQEQQWLDSPTLRLWDGPEYRKKSSKAPSVFGHSAWATMSKSGGTYLPLLAEYRRWPPCSHLLNYWTYSASLENTSVQLSSGLWILCDYQQALGHMTVLTQHTCGAHHTQPIQMLR